MAHRDHPDSPQTLFAFPSTDGVCYNDCDGHDDGEGDHDHLEYLLEYPPSLYCREASLLEQACSVLLVVASVVMCMLVFCHVYFSML